MDENIHDFWCFCCLKTDSVSVDESEKPWGFSGIIMEKSPHLQ